MQDSRSPVRWQSSLDILFAHQWMKTQQSPSMVISFGLGFPGTYPLIITGRQCMGTYKGSPIYRVTSMRFLNCNRSLQNSTSQEVCTWFHSSLYVCYLIWHIESVVTELVVLHDNVHMVASAVLCNSVKSSIARLLFPYVVCTQQFFNTYILVCYRSGMRHIFWHFWSHWRKLLASTFHMTLI
jgi:hypothetical protein